MAKFHITIEDNEENGGVDISVHGGPSEGTKAGQLTCLMVEQARFIGRIPVPKALMAGPGCGCDSCQAMREKIALNPTIH